MEPAGQEGTCHSGLEKGTICPTRHWNYPPCHIASDARCQADPRPHRSPPDTPRGGSGSGCGAIWDPKGRRCHWAGTARQDAEHRRIICSQHVPPSQGSVQAQRQPPQARSPQASSVFPYASAKAETEQKHLS